MAEYNQDERGIVFLDEVLLLGESYGELPLFSDYLQHYCHAMGKYIDSGIYDYRRQALRYKKHIEVDCKCLKSQ